MSKENGISHEATEASPKPRDSTPPTWKKRWHFHGVIVVTTLSALIVIIYLLRSAIFPNYLGLLVALCVAGCGLLLVRRVIRLMAEFDKMQEAHPDEYETVTRPSEAIIDNEKAE